MRSCKRYWAIVCLKIIVKYLFANVLQVIAVCDTEENGALVRDKGAWAALGFVAGETPNNRLRKTAMYASDSKGASIIFDTVGGEAFKESLKW